MLIASKVSTSQSYADILAELGELDPSIVVIDAGLATSMQTNLFSQKFPGRYFNLGIAEQNVVGVASGLARRGFTPLVHSFSNFLARRARDQIAVSVAWPRCNVKLIAGSCGVFDGRNGFSHMAVDDIAAIASLPEIAVVEPADLFQTKSLLFQIASEAGPAYFRLRRHGAPLNLLGERMSEGGTAVLESSQQAVCTLVAAGSMLQEVQNAVGLLKKSNTVVDLIHVSVLRPFSGELIIRSGRRTGRIVTVENHVATGGFGDTVDRVTGELPVRRLRLALPDAAIPAGEPSWQLAFCGLDAESIAKSTIEFISRS